MITRLIILAAFAGALFAQQATLPAPQVKRQCSATITTNCIPVVGSGGLLTVGAPTAASSPPTGSLNVKGNIYKDGVLFTGSGGSGTVGSVTVAGTSNQITVTGTCTATDTISCTLSIPSVFSLPGTINKITLTAPASGATLTLVDGKTLTASNTLTLAGTDGSTVTFGAGGTVLYTNSSGGSFPTLNQNTTGTASNVSGTPALPNGTTAATQSANDNTTKLATTAYADTMGALKANLAGPTFSGTPAAPTAAADTNTTQLATTAFYAGQQGTATPVINGTAAAGTSLKFSPIDHVHPTDTSRAPLASPTFTGTLTIGPTSLAAADGTIKAVLVSQLPAASTLIAHWDMHEGSGTTAHDLTANAYDMTLANAGFTPTWIAGGGLSFDGSANEYTYAPSGLNPQTVVTACALVDNSPTVGGNGFFPMTIVATNGSSPWVLATSASGVSPQNFMPATSIGTTLKTSSRDTAYGLVHICAVRGSSADTIYINGQVASAYYSTTGTLSTTSNGILTLGESPGSGMTGGAAGNNGTYSPYTGKIYDVAVWSTALTSAQIVQSYRAALDGRLLLSGVPVKSPNKNTSTTNQMLCVGDSLTGGSNSSVAGGYCASSRLTTTETFALNNVGIGGMTTAQMISANVTGAGGQSQLYLLAPSAKWNVVEFWGGTNDLCNGVNATTAQVLTNTLIFAAAAANAGWKVIVNTMISRSGNGTGGGTCDSLKNTMNGLLRSAIPTFLPGQVFLNDIAADTNLGADSAYSSGTYFSGDHTHLTDAGYVLVANYSKSLINQITKSGGVNAEPTCTIAALPTVPFLGQHCYFTDASTTSDCATGSGTAKSLCIYNGTAWAKP